MRTNKAVLSSQISNISSIFIRFTQKCLSIVPSNKQKKQKTMSLTSAPFLVLDFFVFVCVWGGGGGGGGGAKPPKVTTPYLVTLFPF